MTTLGGCYSLTELFARVGSSEQMAYWLLYLELREEEAQPSGEAAAPPPPSPERRGAS